MIRLLVHPSGANIFLSTVVMKRVGIRGNALPRSLLKPGRKPKERYTCAAGHMGRTWATHGPHMGRTWASVFYSMGR